MTGLLDVQTPRSPQGLKGEISIIFAEQDREIGENIRESLMRSGFIVTEKPDRAGTGTKQAGTVLYLASAGLPKAMTATVPKAEPTGIRRQLSIWRSLCAAATIGLIAFIGVSGSLYQQNQSVSRDVGIAIEQRDNAIAERQQMNDELYAANVTKDGAIAERDRAIAERQQMNNELYVANVTTDRALAARDRAVIERKQMNDDLYVVNVMRDKAIESEQRANQQIRALQANLDRQDQQIQTLQKQLNESSQRNTDLQKDLGESNQRIEALQKELDETNRRNDLLEDLLRERFVQSSQPREVVNP